MSQPQGFVLFAHPRSGSTTLAAVLGAHPELRVVMDPLDPSFTRGRPDRKDYLACIHDTESLDAQVQELFAQYEGLKVLCWPLDAQLYEHLLVDPRWRIIFLRRRNMLRAAISNAIASRTGAWQKRDLPADASSVYSRLEAIPLDELRDWIDAVSKDMDRYEQVLDQRPPNMVRKVTYEGLYDDPSGQPEAVTGLFRFLGVRPLFTETMGKLLDRGSRQMNSAITYRLVPNCAEIEASLGSREHGYLFRD